MTRGALERSGDGAEAVARPPAGVSGSRPDAAREGLLRLLAERYPTSELALAELAGLRAALSLPPRSVHILSDVHGEHGKLRHVVNNGSGLLRPMVRSLLSGSLTEAEQRELLSVIYYPAETLATLKPRLLDEGNRRAWLRRTLHLLFELIRTLSRSCRREEFNALLPPEYAELFKELYSEPLGVRPAAFVDLMLGAYELQDQDWQAVRAASRLVRNLCVGELLVLGDLGDRGPRIDLVIDFLQQQPNVQLVWGNHDAHWMGACLGQAACIASVVRFSLKYGRTAQLEEGYGISLRPLDMLAESAYAADPASSFRAAAVTGRPPQLAARMLKAVTVLQLKLEGQLVRRWPEWELGHRDVLAGVRPAEGVVQLDGRTWPLADRSLPTLDPTRPDELTEDERRCMQQLRDAFVGSPRLWQHMRFVLGQGGMWTRRDELLMFHGCVPVDGRGEPLPLTVDGHPCAGRELMDRLAAVVHRAFRHSPVPSPLEASERHDADWLWYLWCGPRSPLFGKDKIATFEAAFVADPAAKVENKNPYFQLLHDAAFVRKVGRWFGCGDDVLLVNGHVPVRVELGESPVKRGGNAVTIDGAFSEAYGDRGYTLLLTPWGVHLAEHTHFESVEAAVHEGRDIVPSVTPVRLYEPPRRVADTAEGETTRERIRELETLLTAYREGRLREGTATRRAVP